MPLGLRCKIEGLKILYRMREKGSGGFTHNSIISSLVLSFFSVSKKVILHYYIMILRT